MITPENGRLAEQVLAHLACPQSTYLGTRITKKMLLDNNELSRAEKKLITDAIQSMVWQHTLKPETINIPVYVTDTHEYLEIAVIRVVLKTTDKPLPQSTVRGVAKLLHNLIPYPVILLLEAGDTLTISLADKRINQADKTKLVVAHSYHSDCLHPKLLSCNEQDFLNDFTLTNVSNLNYFECYQGLISMLIGLETSKITGRYVSNDLATSPRNEEKTRLLLTLETLEAELSSIRNKIKKETHMNAKMRLNMEAKQIKQSISDTKQQALK